MSSRGNNFSKFGSPLTPQTCTEMNGRLFGISHTWPSTYSQKCNILLGLHPNSFFRPLFFSQSFELLGTLQLLTIDVTTWQSLYGLRRRWNCCESKYNFYFYVWVRELNHIIIHYTPLKVIWKWSCKTVTFFQKFSNQRVGGCAYWLNHYNIVWL